MARPDLINRFRNLVPYGIQWITREYICEKTGASLPDVDDCFQHFIRTKTIREMQQSIPRREERWHKREIALDSDRSHVRFYIVLRPCDWMFDWYDQSLGKKTKPQRLCKLCQKPILHRHQKAGFHDKDKCDEDQTEWVLKS